MQAFLLELGFHEINVIVYLRSPIDTVCALHSTAVILGSTSSSPPGPENAEWRDLCDHQKTLTRYANVFGRDAVLPRIYDRKELINGSIINDFIHAVDLKIDINSCELPKTLNTSLSNKGLQLLKIVNQALPYKPEEHYADSSRSELISLIAQTFQEGEKFTLNETLRNEYETFFKDSNEWVRKEYFPDKETLFEDKHYSAKSETKETISLEEAAELINSIWKYKEEETFLKQVKKRVQLIARSQLSSSYLNKLSSLIRKLYYKLSK